MLAPRDHPGGPWQQQDGLEMVVYMLLFDFGVILGPVYISFLNSRNLKFDFVFGLVSRSFFNRFLGQNFGTRDFQIEVFAYKILQKSTSPVNRF